MKKTVSIGLMMLFFWSWFIPSSWGYSYGKPDEEPIADTYQKAVGLLGQQNPDFAQAEKELATVEQEMSQHAEIGPELPKVIKQALEQKDAEKALAYWREALVRNIQRRLDNVEKDFKNFSSNKILLAKANRAFEVLSVDLEQRNPSEIPKLKENFQKALDSLGNPGLFNVGKKEAHFDQFMAAKKHILMVLQKEYIPKNEKVQSGGKGHLKEKKQASVAEQSETKWGQWLPLVVIVLVLIGSILLFLLLGRNKK
ncbi:hypothetical protein SAMN05444392_10717 [Seinonella peptonophila]|uniref:Sporulation protein YpjB n=1 Tax=Seinonella peptonophila TaxID=112248 RepID=A0A1M4YLS1_9BACL|nr:hypothetical protein [Seinonella peptonophila]SHF06472.1 hypothetical protein SAMN05444392_10717 [Seinonella peptonophila]